MIEAVAISGEPNAEKRSCYDCQHCKAACSWWCTNQEAIEYRGTQIPGVHSCKFWKPVRSVKELTWWQRVFELDYIGIKL